MRLFLSFPSLVIFAIALGIASAEEDAGKVKIEKGISEKSNRDNDRSKSYDELYADILSNLPKDAKAKVDSAQSGGSQKGDSKKAKVKTAEELRKLATEKRSHEMKELPTAVKARVDKVLSDLDTRRKEKVLEFKEINP